MGAFLLFFILSSPMLRLTPLRFTSSIHKPLTFVAHRSPRRPFSFTPHHQAPRFRPSSSEPPHVLTPTEAASLVSTLRSRSVHEPIERVSYTIPLVFGGIVCTGAFITAGIIYDRNQQTVWQRWLADNNIGWRWLRGDPRAPRPTMGELWQEKRRLILEKRQQWMDRVVATLGQWQQIYGLPETVRRMALITAGKWASMTESERTLFGLIAINVVVFGAWQVPRWTPFMSRWFLHHPGSNRPLTLITSCFSHKEGLHLACNMVGLWSFGGLVHDYLGREQFLALYLSTGVGANMVSHAVSLAMRKSRPLLPSLGASGAIYGLLSSTAYLQPQASVSLIFLPFFPIKLG